MRCENYGLRLVNDDTETLDIHINPDDEGHILKLAGAEWWIDDLDRFVDEIAKFASSRGREA